MKLFSRGAWRQRVAVLFFAFLIIPITIASAALQHKPPARAKVDELFNRNCARCHGGDGKGDTPSGHLFKPPDFSDPNWWKNNSSSTSTNALRTVVTRGKASMPAFGKKLTKSQINALVD